MSENKVLVIYNHFLPAWKAGGPIRSIAEIVYSLHQAYDFYILTSAFDHNEKKNMDFILPKQWIKWEDKAHVFYHSKPTTSVSFFLKHFKDLNPNVIFINGLFSLYYNILPLLAAFKYTKINPKTKIILSPRGMLHPGALSQKKIKKNIYLLLFNLLRFNKKVHWHATDEKEVHFIRNKFKNAKISIASNLPRLSNQLTSPRKQKGQLIMGTLALISPMKNHLEIINVLKSINDNVVWHIYGPIKDIAYWEICKKNILDLPSNIQVLYHGAIPPDQVLSELKNIQIFILPSKSENFAHSICEALSCGKPVITTDTTPYSNLQHFSAGYTLRYNQLRKDMIDAIQYFINMGESEFASHSSSATIYIKNKMNIQNIISQYQNLFKSV